MLNWWYLPCYIGGDFKVTQLPNKGSSEVRLCSTMVKFSNFTFYQGLMDLPLVGRNFTRSNNQESPSWSRVDKFLVSSTWEAQFPYGSKRRLPRFCSDHFSSSLTMETFKEVVGTSSLKICG